MRDGSAAARAAGRKAAAKRIRTQHKHSKERTTAREASERRLDQGQDTLDEVFGFPSIRTFGNADFTDPYTGVKYKFAEPLLAPPAPGSELHLYYKMRRADDSGPEHLATLQPARRRGQAMVVDVLSVDFDESRACTGAVVARVVSLSAPSQRGPSIR